MIGSPRTYFENETFIANGELCIENENDTNRSITITLVGNKSDLPDSERNVSKQQGEDFARENGLLFFETSAKTGKNVQDVFQFTAVSLRFLQFMFYQCN